MNDYAFGNFLYTLRTEKSLSQTQLGEMLGVTNKAVSKWENGSAKPNTSLLPKLAEILGATVEELFACKRIEKDTEYENIKNYLLEQKKKYAIRASLFLSLIITLPLLLIEFIAVIMGFALPDEIIGPLGSVGIIFAFAISLTAYIIHRNNFRLAIAPTELKYEPQFIRSISIGTMISAITVLSLLLLTIGGCSLIHRLTSNHLIANIYLSITALIFIISLGIYICFANIGGLLKIKFVDSAKQKRKRVRFSELPKWQKVCLIAFIILYPVTMLIPRDSDWYIIKLVVSAFLLMYLSVDTICTIKKK